MEALSAGETIRVQWRPSAFAAVAGTVRIAIDAKVRAQRERKAPFCKLVEPDSETRGGGVSH